MKRYIILVMAIVCLMALSPASSQAAVILDFNMDAIHPAGSSISYAGGANPLVGVDISVDTVTGQGTPLNDGVTKVISDGLLTFTTGNFNTFDSSTWVFLGGGSISVTGGVTDLGIANGTTLLAGEWTEASVTKTPTGTFKVTIGSFLDIKNPELADYYGLVGGENIFWKGNINLSFNATGSPPNGFRSSSVLSGDIVNNAVPEPGTMLLLGSGLVGLAGWGRKKFRK